MQKPHTRTKSPERKFIVDIALALGTFLVLIAAWVAMGRRAEPLQLVAALEEEQLDAA